ncbi:DUF4432 family protein [Natronobiforma cellulositropha]|uniref:DUF4432 family protein n=1 Tax=Natronobiforma cellulositropha TaxID=1679076 RepID=UPI0021D5A926|nr:DUF4432 family protein [Natronobiforma cellulositropha]
MTLRVSDEYTRRGIDTVFLENDHLRVEVLAGKGGDVTEIRDKRTDVNVLLECPHEWRAPADGIVGAPDPAFAFMDHYPGGWNGVLPAAGAPTEHHGATLALHGESSLVPFDAQPFDDAGRVGVRLTADLTRYPLHLERELSLSADESALRWAETVTNTGAVGVDYSWLQHVALGEPLVSPGATLEIDCERVLTDPDHDPDTRRLPRGEAFDYPICETDDGPIDLREFPPREERVHDLAAFADLAEGRYTVTNPDLDLGATLEFDADLYEYVWYWGAFGGFETAPYFGRNYNVGLEPCTSIPTQAGLDGQLENETANHLEAGETVSTTLTLETHAAE